MAHRNCLYCRRAPLPLPGPVVRRIRKNRKTSGFLLTALEFLLFGISGIVIGFGVIKKPLPLLVPYSQGDYFMAGIVIALGAILLLRWRMAFEKEITEP